MAWTNEQLNAIHKDGTNIIVSAGAGSGKTAVLPDPAPADTIMLVPSL